MGKVSSATLKWLIQRTELFQATSISAANALSQKASAASMKNINSSLSILQWGGGTKLFFVWPLFY
jgi:hypothetical protein